MSWDPATGSLDLATLGAAYRSGALTPAAVVAAVHDRILAAAGTNAFIHVPPREALLERAAAVMATPAASPFWGIPFSVKDCNDVPGMPTTNGLPESAYVPEGTGQVIARLLAAGAICVGKTNMDQFGIGLVGVRTPYGACRSPFAPAFIAGGSSSGSAVSVALGLASFSIGNDAAGSGRVPAGFCNIIGIKPTPGLVSNAAVTGGGCVKTIETTTIFALTVADGMATLRAIAGHDPTHPFSDPEADAVDLADRPAPARFRFGIPSGEGLRFFGDAAAEALFQTAVARLESLGGTAIPVDFAPFEEVQRILYDGPWIAERALTLDPVLARHGPAIHPVTRQILSQAATHSAGDVFRAIHRIAELKAATRPVLAGLEALVVPTTPTTYRLTEIEAEPIALNSRLGIYTNFVNLMGLSGVAVPAGFRPDGPALGVTFLGPRFREAQVAALAARHHRALGGSMGATGNPLPG